MRSARLGLVWGVVVAAGCGAHLHRPYDASTAEQAATELKSAQLTDGFAPEQAQAAEMLAEELKVARAWAQAGRDRDLLDVLSATAVDERDPDTEILLHPRCRGRFAGDGWATLCHKLARRTGVLGGFDAPGKVVAVKATKGKPAPAVVDPVTVLATRLRGLSLEWHGPHSDEAQIGRAGTDLGLRATNPGLSQGTGAQAMTLRTPRCPARPLAGADARVTEAGQRLAALCQERVRNLEAVQQHAGGLLAEQAKRTLAVHAALARYDAGLAQRIAVFEQARRACTYERAGKVAPTVSAISTAVTELALPGCDAGQVQRAFAALADGSTGDELRALDYAALAREGRATQLSAQLAALTELMDARETRKRSDQPAGLVAGDSTPLAHALHQTIEGIDKVRAVTDAFSFAVLGLIRETLRVEHAALTTAAGHAERRRRVELAKLSAQLDEYTLLVEAFARLQKLEAAGCTGKPLIVAQAQDGCRDDATRVLQSLSNAWTLGRAAQREADVLDLAVRHQASIDMSRAAMAVREVYLAAGVAELVKFNKGGIAPETLALLIVNAVGFGVVAGGVY